MLRDPSDEALVKKALKGRADAWEKLVTRYQGKLFNFALRVLGNRDDALDLIQDVLLAVYRNLDRFRAESSFKSWLFSIASRRVADFYRRAKPTEALPEGDHWHHQNSREESPFGLLIQRENNRRVLEFMAQLSSEQRLVVELKFFQQQTFDEMAEQLGVSANTLKSRLYGALKKLKSLPEVVNAM